MTTILLAGEQKKIAFYFLSMHTSTEIIIVSAPSESPESFITTTETLESFGIFYRHIFAKQPFENQPEDQNAVFCLIVRSHPDALAWANTFYPHTPKLLIPQATQEGWDSLQAIIQTANQPVPQAMPTFALGKAGETNAALFAISMIALKRKDIRKKLLRFREDQTRAILARSIPGE